MQVRLKGKRKVKGQNLLSNCLNSHLIHIRLKLPSCVMQIHCVERQ